MLHVRVKLSLIPGVEGIACRRYRKHWGSGNQLLLVVSRRATHASLGSPLAPRESI